MQQLEKQIAVADAEASKQRESSEQAAAALLQVQSVLEAERSTKAILQYVSKSVFNVKASHF